MTPPDTQLHRLEGFAILFEAGLHIVHDLKTQELLRDLRIPRQPGIYSIGEPPFTVQELLQNPAKADQLATEFQADIDREFSSQPPKLHHNTSRMRDTVSTVYALEGGNLQPLEGLVERWGVSRPTVDKYRQDGLFHVQRLLIKKYVPGVPAFVMGQNERIAAARALRRVFTP